jgi:hypothetical protein
MGIYAKIKMLRGLRNAFGTLACGGDGKGLGASGAWGNSIQKLVAGNYISSLKEIDTVCANDSKSNHYKIKFKRCMVIIKIYTHLHQELNGQDD